MTTFKREAALKKATAAREVAERDFKENPNPKNLRRLQVAGKREMDLVLAKLEAIHPTR